MGRKVNLLKLKEELQKEKQKLEALKRKMKEEYRKREARFLIAIGRSVLKYGRYNPISGKIEVEPNIAIKEAFKEHADIVELNDDFRKWLKWIND